MYLFWFSQVDRQRLMEKRTRMKQLRASVSSGKKCQVGQNVDRHQMNKVCQLLASHPGQGSENGNKKQHLLSCNDIKCHVSKNICSKLCIQM